MEILIATDAFAPKIDGAADTAGIVARILARRGHNVRVVAPAPGPSRIDRFRVARIPSLACPLYPELRLALPDAAAVQIRRCPPPDAVIVLTPGFIGLSAVYALPPPVRLINVYTTDIPRYLRAYGLGVLRRPVEGLLRRMSTRAAVTLCPTVYVRDELAARGYPRLAVWGRGADLTLFDPTRRSAAMRLRLTGGEPEKPLVLYVGRLAREKRLLDLHAAARRLPGVRFAIVGDGPQRDLLERRFADVPAVFTGYLRGAPLAEAFASADLFAFPSDSETFGQVVLQAMASGVPPVVVRGTAPAEFVADGVAGLHVPPRSPDAIAAAIAGLIHDTQTRLQMSRNARRCAQHHSWDALLDRLEVMLGAPAATDALMGER